MSPKVRKKNERRIKVGITGKRSGGTTNKSERKRMRVTKK